VRSDDVESCFRPAVDAIVVRLSSVLPRGDAKHILLSGVRPLPRSLQLLLSL